MGAPLFLPLSTERNCKDCIGSGHKGWTKDHFLSRINVVWINAYCDSDGPAINVCVCNVSR